MANVILNGDCGVLLACHDDSQLVNDTIDDWLANDNTDDGYDYHQPNLIIWPLMLSSWFMVNVNIIKRWWW